MGTRNGAAAILVAAFAALAMPGGARADARAYRGPHPIDLEGHWHLEDAVHVHDDLPAGTGPFGDAGGVLVFLADPLAWGWTGEVWTYGGAHPLPGGLAGYCGIAGEHRHPFAPEGAFRRASSGTYVYTGAMRGGLPMVTPSRPAPPHPIVAIPAPTYGAPAAPFWLSGCLHTWVAGPDGRPIAVPLHGCVPRAHPPRRATPARPRPPRYFEGRYTRAQSRPMVRPSRIDRPRQRPDR